MRDIQDFASLKIQLASPDTIRQWSYGEVKKAETINYRTLRPERDGLFCERIFGTTKEWECYCGKFKSIRYKGVKCDRCGVEVTHFKVRRERTGHIELAAPVSHIWYYRSVPSRMGLLLDLQVAALRSVLYYEKYIVIEPGETDLNKYDLLNDDEYQTARERFGNAFVAEMGAEAIKTLLENLDLDELSAELRAKMTEKGAKCDKRLLKRIEIVENFRTSGNKASWMILDVIPVIPPDLRPMVPLEAGRFATSDLNDLYRRVINRNNRLKRFQALYAPDLMIRNEKRMLQESVDALFDNTKRKRVVKGASNRPLKSISDLLKGKQGRFRQNLLGKRVDYSGRSVIVVGPELKLWQCGLPTKMALELFKPFIMKKLVDKDVVVNVKKAKTLVDNEDPAVFAVLDEVVREHPVMLNRAPTLHRLGIQAFEPVLVQGKALKLHPLACKAFNADFDGDQMAIHVPLTQAAQMECWTLMLSARNLLDPASGNTIVAPSQDMVLGIYYMTSVKPQGKGTGKRYSDKEEAYMACDAKALEWQSEIRVPAPRDAFEKDADGNPVFKKGDIITTTAGRLRFNDEMPEGVGFVNKQMIDKDLKKMIETVFANQGAWLTIQMLDAIKSCGYKNATFFGATLCMDDILIPEEKKQLVEEANKETEKFIEQYNQGNITGDERYKKVTDLWTKVNDQLTDIMMGKIKKDKDGFNTIWMMAHSGARGSKKQISQLAAMRGLMAKPNGAIIELPIRSNFKEGLSVIEYFISTNGARKGLSDTALKTADAGYMTRRLVDVSQDVVVNEDDCGTINGIEYRAIKDGEKVIESLESRIVGHYSIERVIDPVTGELLCDVNQYIDEKLAKIIDKAGVEKVKLRTVLTCESKHGVCVHCYGKNLARNKIVEIGEAVGTIAAQSIGQPGTQLTLRTFHQGGAADSKTEENKIYFDYPVYVEDVYCSTNVTTKKGWLFTRKGYVLVSKIINKVELKKGVSASVEEGTAVRKEQVIASSKDGDIKAAGNGTVKIVDGNLLVLSKAAKSEISNGSTVFVAKGAIVEAKESIGEFDPFSEPIIAEQSGYIHFDDIQVGITLEEIIDPKTENTTRQISSLHLDEHQPKILIMDEDGNEIGSYHMPAGAQLLVEDKQKIAAGEIIAKLAKEAKKSSDITGGLPRVSELFEARRPKPEKLAYLAPVSGTVSFGKIVKGKREVIIRDKYYETSDSEALKERHQAKVLVPSNKRLLVRDGDQVEAGEVMTDGSVDAHDVLAILGENALMNYLMDEIQAVYRAQSVSINDKHIGVIVRQMLRKVVIENVGDTNFIYGDQVDKYTFRTVNEKIIASGGQPAIAKPMFQGITKAALATDSFISASSFQETTRVLTNAAIAGKVDNLRGLKENVIIGHMIPAGTGMPDYRKIKLYDSSDNDLDSKMEEILAIREQEKFKATQQEIDMNAPDTDED